MNDKLKQFFTLLSCGIVEVILYIFLHEAGHALVGIACGAKITAFSMIGAYTSSVGGTFNVLTHSLMYMAGMAFPLILAVFYMLFLFDKNRMSNWYRLLSMFFCLVPIMTLLTWALVPVAYMAGDTTSADDTIQFLNTSGINPTVVMIVSLLLFSLLLLLAWKKGMIQIWLELVQKNKK